MLPKSGSQRLARLQTVIYLLSLALISSASQQYVHGAKPAKSYHHPLLNRKLNLAHELLSIRDTASIHNHSDSLPINQQQLIESCSKGDISIVQGQSSSMPSGIPTFSVEIFNMCVAGCAISNVHIACGWFASAKLVNPKVFRRIKFNDCLVNNGAPIRGGETCTSRDISISQSRDATPGIPQFIVQIINTCTSGCTPSDIHLNCGWFASAGTINPKVFRRVAYNDCVVNGGGPLAREAIVRFTYRNSFMYPLSFKSAKFC